MSIGFIFWLIMLLCILFGFYSNGPAFRTGNYAPLGNSLLLFILLFLLGWKVFGFIIQG